MSMKFSQIILEKTPNRNSVLTVNKSGLYFSAPFIRTHRLEDTKAIRFMNAEQDPYVLGFDFLTEKGEPNSLVLCKSTSQGYGSNGRLIKASELFSQMSVLKAIAKLPNRAQRTFEIEKDDATNFFFVRLRPSFERSFKRADIEMIPEEARGIYRYRHGSDVVYIGHGHLKARSKDQQRRDWVWDKYEYSVVPDKDIAKTLEAQYLQAHEQQYGVLPRYNAIRGHHVEIADSTASKVYSNGRLPYQEQTAITTG